MRISIDEKNAGQVVPHPMAENWRIILPTSDAIKARKAAKGCQRNPRGFFSAKCHRLVVVNTLLESSRALMLEADPNVILYEEAPFILQYSAAGGVVSISPSFLILRVGGRMKVEEVTARALAEKPGYSKRMMMEKMVLEQYDYEFYLVTEEDLSKGVRYRG